MSKEPARRHWAVSAVINVLWLQAFLAALTTACIVTIGQSAVPPAKTTTQLSIMAIWGVLFAAALLWCARGIGKRDNGCRIAGYPVVIGYALVPIVVIGAPLCIPVTLLQLYLLRHRAVREWCQASRHPVASSS